MAKTLLREKSWRTGAWLAKTLRMDRENLGGRHLSPMPKNGVLERLYSDTPTDARQAYRCRQDARRKLIAYGTYLGYSVAE